jgi:hypothetical protein
MSGVGEVEIYSVTRRCVGRLADFEREHNGNRYELREWLGWKRG